MDDNDFDAEEFGDFMQNVGGIFGSDESAQALGGLFGGLMNTVAQAGNTMFNNPSGNNQHRNYDIISDDELDEEEDDDDDSEDFPVSDEAISLNKDLEEEAIKMCPFSRSFLPHMNYFSGVFGSLPLNWKTALHEGDEPSKHTKSHNGKIKYKFSSIEFKDDAHITDAVLEAWFWHMKDSCLTTISSIDLSGCCYLTDWGMHWLAQILQGRTGNIKVILDGCVNITEKGLIELCNAGPVLDLSCQSTMVGSIPDYQTRKQNRFKLQNCPMLQTAMLGFENEEKIYGPYSKVMIYNNPLASISLLHYIRDGKNMQQKSLCSSSSVEITDSEVEPMVEMENKVAEFNIIQTNENNPSHGLLTKEEFDQVIIPFDTEQNVDAVSDVVAEILAESSAKEVVCSSSAFEKKTCSMPTPLWSVQSLQGVIVDMETGIFRSMRTDEMELAMPQEIWFKEQLNSYYHRLDVEILECKCLVDSKQPTMSVGFISLDSSIPGGICPLFEDMEIQPGFSIQLAYDESGKNSSIVNGKQNEQESSKTMDSIPEQHGFPYISLDENVVFKLKVNNFNCVPQGIPHQLFMAHYFRNSETIFDPSSGTVRFDNTKASGDVQLFQGIHPVNKFDNTVEIEITNLGERSTITLGVIHNNYDSKNQPGWRDNSIAFHCDDRKVYTLTGSGTSTTLLDKKIAVGDIIKFELDYDKRSYVRVGDSYSITFFVNNKVVKRCDEQLKGDRGIYLIPAIGLHSPHESVRILNFCAPPQLHETISPLTSGMERYLVTGSRNVKLKGDVLESGPNCRDRQFKEYFVAANSLTVNTDSFKVCIQKMHLNNGILAIGLVHQNFDARTKSPGNALGTIGMLFNPTVGNTIHSGKTVIQKNDRNIEQHDNIECSIVTESAKFGNNGLLLPNQTLKIKFKWNKKQICDAKFNYLGGGLYPCVSFGYPNIQVSLPNLLTFETMKNLTKETLLDLPVKPGTQYILAGLNVHQGAESKWPDMVKNLKDQIIQKIQQHYIRKAEKERLKRLKKVQVDHFEQQQISQISRMKSNLEKIVSEFDHRVHFVCLDMKSKQGKEVICQRLLQNLKYNIQHHPYLYKYTEDTLEAFMKIMKHSTEKILPLQEIEDWFADVELGSRYVKKYLERLQKWGKVMLFMDLEPPIVVLDPEWFIRVLEILPDQQTQKIGKELLFLHENTDILRPRELMKITSEKLEQNKIHLLLQILVEQHQAFRLKPCRNDKNDAKYYFLYPSKLGPSPCSESVLAKFIESNDRFISASKTYVVKFGSMLPCAWYSVLSGITFFCTPVMMWKEGLVWHQGAAEFVLMAEKQGSKIRKVVLKCKTYISQDKHDQVESNVKDYLEGVFRIFQDIIDTTLLQNGVITETSYDNIDTHDKTTICAVHRWERPMWQKEMEVCTLCNNCCNEGVFCDYNGILDDNYLTCKCGTENICCWNCGICQSCAKKLWKYASLLRPGILQNWDSERPYAQKVFKRVSPELIDGVVLNQFQIRVEMEKHDSMYKRNWGLLSEDNEEMIVFLSYCEELACPKVVYSCPVNSGIQAYNFEFFNRDQAYRTVSAPDIYNICLYQPKMIQTTDHHHPMNYNYNFMSCTRLRFYQNTGIAECDQNSWNSNILTGFLISKYPFTQDCFYYEVELLSIGEEGFVCIGAKDMENKVVSASLQFGFKTTPSQTEMGHLGHDHDTSDKGLKYSLGRSALSVGEKIGIGMFFEPGEEYQTLFFVRNGEKKSLELKTNKELYGHLVIQGHGWKVRLTTRGVWRGSLEDIHEAVEAKLDHSKKSQAWANYDVIELSPATVLPFEVVAAEPNKIAAEIYIKAKPHLEHSVLYKVKVTNPKAYLVRPNKGIIKPGETISTKVFGKIDELGNLNLASVKDKFRIEWRIDEKDLSEKFYGTGFGRNKERDGPFSIMDNKWTVAWNESLNDVSKAVLTCKLSDEKPQQISGLESFVKNIYMQKRAVLEKPKPLPTLSDGWPQHPHYILEVRKNGKLCSQSWIPKKRYYLSKIGPDVAEEDNSGVFIPRLPKLMLPNALRKGMKVYMKADIHSVASLVDSFSVLNDPRFAIEKKNQTLQKMKSILKTSDSRNIKKAPISQKKKAGFSLKENVIESDSGDERLDMDAEDSFSDGKKNIDIREPGKSKKDKNAPKKPVSAYVLWFNDYSEKIKADNPGITLTDIAKKAGELWNELSAEEKAKYDAMQKKARERYDEELKEYQQKFREDDLEERKQIKIFYIPCKIMEIIESSKIYKVQSELSDKKEFDVDIGEMHSELWIRSLTKVYDYIIKESPQEHMFIVKEDIRKKMREEIALIKWHEETKSDNLTIKEPGNMYVRGLIANSTDGARANLGYRTGTHVFRFEYSMEGKSPTYGSYFQIGVCTEKKTSFQRGSYGLVIGTDEHSWGWDIPSNTCCYRGAALDKKETDARNMFTIDMKLNIKDVNWPYVHFSFPDKSQFGFTAFQGETLSKALMKGHALYPCVAGVYGGHSVKITLLNSSDRDDDVADFDQFVYFESDQSKDNPYDVSPLPYLFPLEKEEADMFNLSISPSWKKFYSNYLSTIIEDNSQSSFKTCHKSSLCTTQSRQWQLLTEFTLMDGQENFLPEVAFVPLPKEMDIPTVSFPCLQTLMDIGNLLMHFICKPEECDFLQLCTEKYRLHFMDKPGVAPVKALSEDVMLYLPAMTCLYMACVKVLLPKYANLFTSEVCKKIPRVQLENQVQSILKLYASTVCANFSQNLSVFLMTRERDDALNPISANEHDQLFEKFKQCLPVDVRQEISNSTPDHWMCNSHLYALSPEKIGDEMFPPTLDLKPYEPYNELLHKIVLTTNVDLLEEIPDDFQDMFPNLHTLFIDQANSLKKLPSSVKKLKKLSVVWITVEDNIQIAELPEDIGELKELSELRLSRAYMKKLPDSLCKTHFLTTLSVSSNGLRELPSEFSRLYNLIELLLNFNPIFKLPQGISNLKCLTCLYLAGVNFLPMKTMYQERDIYNKWFEYQGSDITKYLPLKRAEELFDTCKISEEGSLVTSIHKVNAHLFYEVPRLGIDYIQHDEDGGIPEEIFNLENLENLDLSNQAIRYIPSQISKLTKLEKLTLNKNILLESLPGSLGRMQRLRKIALRNCPSLKTPPIEVVGRGIEAIKAFLKRLSGGTTENWRTKLMLVGLGGAGKTSLLQALTSPTYKTVGTKSDEITDGIDIKSWTVKQQDVKISFSTWDFAGQDVYYNTHQFFLSERAVYLLLWTCRLGYEHAGLDFWLSSIQCHAPKAPIFVVGTHCDQVAKAELPKDVLMKKYPQIKGFYFVSSIKGTGIEILEKAIFAATKEETYMGENVPTVYLTLENKITNMRKQKSVVPWTDVVNLAVECGIFEEKDIKRAVLFLHDLGAVQYFDNEFLRDHVVINPQWIVDVMACVVSVKDSPIERGRFYHKDISQVWKSYSSDLHEWLLRLTEEFDLTFPIPSQPVNLVPCLLPSTEPEFEWPALKEGFRENMMLYRFTYLPAGLFNRTQVRLFQYSDGKDIWKRGSLLHKNDHIALIKQLSDKELLVKVQGPRPENILFLVHEVIESLIAESFHGVTYDYLIPCPDCMNKGGTPSENGLFEASLVKKAAEWNAPFLQCREHFHTVSMSFLQASLPPDSNVEFDVHLSQSVRALEELRSSQTNDIFVHYCTDDLHNDDSLVHPKKVVDDMIKAGFKCWFRDSLQDIDIQEVTMGLKDSKMMVVFMSNLYEKSKKCRELFLYAKHTLAKPFQVIGYGDNYDWKKTHLGGMEIGSHHVYVNMTDKSRYTGKIDELKNHVKGKLEALNNQRKTYPQCFISYAWSNSHQAHKLGTKSPPGALGWEKGDPRNIKEYLEANGVSCWLDTEQTGKQGLFEDISDGIRYCDVVVACVSTEYATSKNCKMELRFAECSMGKPVVGVKVGTSEKWRSTEIRMLLDRSEAPIVDMQTPNEGALEKLLAYVKERIPKDGEPRKLKKKKTTSPSIKLDEVSFLEEYELAQRKFLRHVSILAASMDTAPFPRLFILDFVAKDRAGEIIEDESMPERPKSVSLEQRPTLHKRESKLQTAVKLPDDYNSNWVDNQFCIRFLCEYDGGCHVSATQIELPSDMSIADKEALVKSWSPYLGRIYTLLKHSTVTLNFMGTDLGKHFVNFIYNSIDDANLDFAGAYCQMRDTVMTSDIDKNAGQLGRCYLPTGQIRWLCDGHQKGHRITLLNSDAEVCLSGTELVTDDVRLMRKYVEELSHLGDPYIKQRPEGMNPRTMSDSVLYNKVVTKKDQLDKIKAINDEKSENTNNTAQGNSNESRDSVGPDKRPPKPIPRRSKSTLNSDTRSSDMQAKMKAAGYVLQNSAEPLQRPRSQETSQSQACHIL